MANEIYQGKFSEQTTIAQTVQQPPKSNFAKDFVIGVGDSIGWGWIAIFLIGGILSWVGYLIRRRLKKLVGPYIQDFSNWING